MAVERYIDVTVRELNGQSGATGGSSTFRTECISIDNIRLHIQRSDGVNQLFYESATGKKDPDVYETTENRATILARADAGGFTQNGLVLVDIVEIDGADHSGAPIPALINLNQKLNRMRSVDAGTEIWFNKESLVPARRIVVSQDLCTPAS